MVRYTGVNLMRIINSIVLIILVAEITSQRRRKYSRLILKPRAYGTLTDKSQVITSATQKSNITTQKARRFVTYGNSE